MLTLSLLLGTGIYHYRIHLKALLQGWSDDLFLTRLERTYPAAQWMNRELPKNARIFVCSEIRQFYFDRPVTDAVSYYRVERYSDKLTPADLLERLKRLGITHILRVYPLGINKGTGKPAGLPYATLDALLKVPGTARLLKEIPSQNIREQRSNYKFYQLN
jgi:hypothetical protein